MSIAIARKFEGVFRCGGGGGMLVRERIRQIIREKGLKQSAVSERLGEPEYWLSNRLTERTDIKADELPRIAQALGVTPCAFFEELAEAQPSRAAESPERYGAREADAVARELAAEWEWLPEAEREFITGLVELRRRYRARTAGR